MMLITSAWQGMPTFRLIPTSQESPFVEAIFAPNNNVLAVIGTNKKNTYKNVPKIDDNGDPVFMKIGARPNGSTIREERRLVETYQEYYIQEPGEIEAFIQKFAENADAFDFKMFFTPEEDPNQSEADLTSVDMKGLIMAK
jgi:hypothetical protein